MASKRRAHVDTFDDGSVQLGLFAEGERTPKPRAQRGPRSVAFAGCPCCTSLRVGLVRQGDHVVWREHWLRTMSGAALPCRASGVALHALPVKRTDDGTPRPTCPCTP